MKVQFLLLAGVLSCSAVWAADETSTHPVTEDGVVKNCLAKSEGFSRY